MTKTISRPGDRLRVAIDSFADLTLNPPRVLGAEPFHSGRPNALRSSSLARSGALVTSGSGVMMLYRQNWARLLYVGWCILGIIIELTTSPIKIMLLPGIVVFAIIAFFLFRPAANAYFSGVDNRPC